MPRGFNGLRRYRKVIPVIYRQAYIGVKRELTQSKKAPPKAEHHLRVTGSYG